MMFWLLIVPVALVAGYFAVVLNWNYSTGERAGWVQKLSRKGWLCKTWEGEMAMVSMPGAIPEKFLFTVRDDAVAESINKVMGKRVTLHYEEKVGLPTSCFGETRHFVNNVLQVEEIPLAPGVVVPTKPAVSPTTPIDRHAGRTPGAAGATIIDSGVAFARAANTSREKLGQVIPRPDRRPPAFRTARQSRLRFQTSAARVQFRCQVSSRSASLSVLII